MDRDKKYYLRVGITVVVSIIILLYGVSFLKDYKIGIQTNDLVVYFPDVNGLKVGDPVGVNGVNKGKVSSIELEGDSVKVSFNLAKDVILKKDYSISVAMIELMSGKQILVKPGKSLETADITKPLAGIKSTDIVTLISSMNTISDDIKEFSEKLNHTIGDLHEVIENVNDIAGDENLKANIRGTASNFNSASRNLNSMIDENRSNLKQLTSELNLLAENMDITLTDTKPELKETLGDIKVLTKRLDSLTVNLNQYVTDTSSTVGKLMTDDELYNNLNKTVISIDKLIKEIKDKGIKLRIF
ncbi:MAG: MlaD family protein [Ignavibacteria bacterium]|jgi:phospholipid/cholesterol/gamma-HCH transport system substrate-binding protein